MPERFRERSRGRWPFGPKTSVCPLTMVLLTAVMACSSYEAPREDISGSTCFYAEDGVYISTSDHIPSMQIVEVKSFVSLSRSTVHGGFCETVEALVERTKEKGANAIVGFSYTVSSAATPLRFMDMYGMAVENE